MLTNKYIKKHITLPNLPVTDLVFRHKGGGLFGIYVEATDALDKEADHTRIASMKKPLFYDQNGFDISDGDEIDMWYDYTAIFSERFNIRNRDGRLFIYDELEQSEYVDPFGNRIETQDIQILTQILSFARNTYGPASVVTKLHFTVFGENGEMDNGEINLSASQSGMLYRAVDRQLQERYNTSCALYISAARDGINER